MRQACIHDVYISFAAISTADVAMLTDREWRALMDLIAAYGASIVGDMVRLRADGLDEARLAGLCRLKPRQFEKVWPAISQFFTVHEGRAFLNRPWVTVGGVGIKRPAIAASLRSFILQRDGFRCLYCGAGDGPFQIDHVVPISRGGAAADPENLVTSCVNCNGSKGAKFLSEWIGEGQ
jgi:HNH endonuclease